MSRWIHQFDYLRLLAIAGVVVIHAVADNALDTGVVGIMSTVGDALSRFAVPCFAIIAGFLSYRKPKESKTVIGFYRSRALLIIPAMIFWIPLHFYWWQQTDQARDISTSLLSGMSDSHLWFLFAILGLYLIAPLLKKIIDNTSRRMALILGCFITLGIAVELLLRFTLPGYDLVFATQFMRLIGFFYFGQYFARYSVPKLKPINQHLLVAFSALAFVGLALVYRYVINGAHPQIFLYEESLLGTIYSYAVFFWLYSAINITDFWPELARKLSAAVFGVYLIHPIILDVAQRLDVNWLFIVDVTILASFGIVLLGRKSSLGRIVFG